MIKFLQSLFSTTPINEVSFIVAFPEKEELKECKIGDYVNLWSPKNKNKIIVYRSGSVGGGGKLGVVPDKYLNRVLTIMDGEYKTEIAELLDDDFCQIKVIKK